MHYYQHHIGDFRSGCFNMTRVERAFYRDMLDIYYDTEKPLPDDLDAVCKLLGVRSQEEKIMVGEILVLKFEQVEGCGWINARCDKEIAEYHAFLEKSSLAGKASAAARAKKASDAKQALAQESIKLNPTIDQPQTSVEPTLNNGATNHKPLTTNQINTPIPPEGGSVRPKRKKRETISLQTYLQECEDNGLEPIPADDAVFTYATKSFISSEALELHWEEFRSRHTMEGAKKYKSWRSAFNNSVRGNWYHLWYFDKQNVCCLTTAGVQAKNLFKSDREEHK